jgi:DNA-binding SARP family transcriptional activator/transposase
MRLLRIFLFGTFDARYGEQPLPGFQLHRVQELFAYLLLNRSHPVSREMIASALWTDSAASRKSLRQTLWQLQTALDLVGAGTADRVLLVEPDRIRLNAAANVWLDVQVFEQAWERCRGVRGQELDAPGADQLRKAAQLYRGDLLESCYDEWCLYERERLHLLQLSILDKLMIYCEIQRQCETGVEYGVQILRSERACERTHRRLMRLHYLMGDRTAALRQYERCVAALAEELGARPSRRTQSLAEQIRLDLLGAPPSASSKAEASPPGPGAPMPGGASTALGSRLKTDPPKTTQDRQRTPYPTDLTDVQWELVQPLIPTARMGGRPREVDLREVLNAIFYYRRSGCRWRMLPHDLPAWSTVHGYYQEWRRDGTWTKVTDTLQSRGRESAPATVSEKQAARPPRRRGHAAPGPSL